MCGFLDCFATGEATGMSNAVVAVISVVATLSLSLCLFLAFLAWYIPRIRKRANCEEPARNIDCIVNNRVCIEPESSTGPRSVQPQVKTRSKRVGDIDQMLPLKSSMTSPMRASSVCDDYCEPYDTLLKPQLPAAEGMSLLRL